MKKIAASILCTLAGLLLMTSCLGNAEEETELSSTVALLTFSINDLKTVHKFTHEGKDTTYTTVMSGSSVKFTIDHANRKVYNTDSIAYGTDITRILVKATADGYVCYLKENGEAGSIEDSIDFTRPVTFRVTSYDELYSRDYEVSIHKHQVHPDSTQWRELTANFAPGVFAKQKAFIKGDQLYVLGNDAAGVCYTTSTTLPDASVWTDTARFAGIAGITDATSAMLIGDTFYLTADGALYRSDNAITWTPVGNPTPVAGLLAVEETATRTAWGVSGNDFVASTDMVEWNTEGALTGEAIKGVATFSHPLLTNKDIKRTIFIAIPTERADTCAKVWTKLSTEKEWVEVKPSRNNPYTCPHLEHLAVIHYAGKMYAFGGKSIGQRRAPVEAFSHTFESADNGVTWRENKRAFSLPEEFKGRDGSFSTATDGEYVWVMWGTTGQVWRGRWNGIK